SAVSHGLQNKQAPTLPGALLMPRKLLFVFLVAASCASCGASKLRTDTPSRSIAPGDINSITNVMLEFAMKGTTPSSLARTITGTPPIIDPSAEYRTYHHGAFRSADGYLITDLEVRVRSGSF